MIRLLGSRSAIPLVCAACLLIGLLSPRQACSQNSDAFKHFDSKIAPLLAKRCLTCHSGNMPKGELDLSSLESAIKGGANGAALLVGNAKESLLWQQVDSQTMPPKHPLADDEKQLLRQWIDGGAVWGTDPIDMFQTSNDARAGRDWWSFATAGKNSVAARRRTTD